MPEHSHAGQEPSLGMASQVLGESRKAGFCSPADFWVDTCYVMLSETELKTRNIVGVLVFETCKQNKYRKINSFKFVESRTPNVFFFFFSQNLKIRTCANETQWFLHGEKAVVTPHDFLWWYNLGPKERRESMKESTASSLALLTFFIESLGSLNLKVL